MPIDHETLNNTAALRETSIQELRAARSQLSAEIKDIELQIAERAHDDFGDEDGFQLWRSRALRAMRRKVRERNRVKTILEERTRSPEVVERLETLEGRVHQLERAAINGGLMTSISDPEVT